MVATGGRRADIEASYQFGLHFRKKNVCLPVKLAKKTVAARDSQFRKTKESKNFPTDGIFDTFSPTSRTNQLLFFGLVKLQKSRIRNWIVRLWMILQDHLFISVSLLAASNFPA